jgi:hypothetical protein
VEFKEPGQKWDSWKKKAEKNTNNLINNANKTEPLKFNGKIWKELKPFLEGLFHKKCAYCEGNYEAGSWMDVEHYRPKDKVADDVNHPGYYWLAYNYQNLLLACNKCNRGSGKSTFFPIEGIRAYLPGHSLEDEKPLLLNPYNDKNIEEHITFGIKGIITGKTDKGRETIKICNLGREELNTARQRSWEIKKIHLLFLGLLKDGDLNLITPDMEYSAYLKASLLRYYNQKKQELTRK